MGEVNFVDIYKMLTCLTLITLSGGGGGGMMAMGIGVVSCRVVS